MLNYNFNHRSVLIALLPPFLRKSRMVAFLYALIFPLISIYNSLIAKRSDFLLQIKRNAQQMLLQRQLNNLYDPVLQRILVYTPDLDELRLNAYLQTEGQSKTIAYQQAEGQTKTDAYMLSDARLHEYNVEAPVFIQDKEFEIKAFLDKYTIASKKYNIIWKS